VSGRPLDRVTIEPFDARRHDRSGFATGVAQVDNFLLRTANKLQAAGNTRVYVAQSDDAVAGFYALNAHAVDHRDLPSRFARDRPRNGAIPAGFIRRIGVDVRHQGQGLGSLLLADAIQRLARASDLLGMAVILLDVLDCGDPVAVQRRLALNVSYGFQPLPTEPLRLFLPMATARRGLDSDVSP